MKQAIRTRAHELGFDDCRFTDAHAPETSDHFTEWIDAGQQGEMAYLSRNVHKRLDPQQVLPGARSVVCVTLNYGLTNRPERPDRACEAPSEPSCHHGVVAQYARHQDYHDVMGQLLRQLSHFIDQQAGSESRSLWYVDTGPILEREFAQRAGIGFVGKHTNVISRAHGNWILLGEILTTAELDPDPSEKNRCGRCTQCLTACPTHAITSPFQLDARRCISYLTIELKGAIPVELRPAIGNRIFGCDDCLAACPWNRFAQESRALQGHRRNDLQTPDLLEWLALDTTAFKRRFRGTPIERSKRRGLLRNVCVALGNVGTGHALPALEKAANDPEPIIAEHARWAIARVESRTRPGQ
jgi:epoxyqueuosine reductase